MVSVIIATKNRQDSLKRCLKSLLKNDLRGAEIIIVYSGRFDNSEKIVRAYKCNKNGLAEARDFGWRKARGEIVVFIDDDVEVTNNWLINVLEPFKDPKVGGVSGPTIVSKDEMKNRDVFLLNKGLIGWFYKKVILEDRDKEIGRITKSGMWTPGSNFYKGLKVMDVDYLEACNMSLRRDLIKKVGGFDLGFKGTSEWCEVDLAMRVTKLGYRLVFNPKSKVYHHVSRDGVFEARVNAKERMENFLRFFSKHGKLNWRFLLNVFFWNGYFVYKALKTKNLRWLGGLCPGLR